MKKLLFVSVFLALSAPLFAKGFFPISFWANYESLEEKVFADAAEAGFTIYFDTHYRTEEAQKRVLEMSEKYGMKARIYDKRIYYSDYREPDFSEKIAEYVSLYKDHPAGLSYHIVDEPAQGSYRSISHKNEEIHKNDPDAVGFINMLPYGITGIIKNQVDRANHERFIEEYMCLVRPDILSYDIYVLAVDRKNDDLRRFYNNIEIIRDKALKYNTPFSACILSTAHGGVYRDPTDDDLRWQVYNTLVYGGKGILYFTYTSLPNTDYWGEGLIARDGSKTRRYYAAKKLNHEILDMADVLMGLRSVAVFHTEKDTGEDRESMSIITGDGSVHAVNEKISPYTKSVPEDNLIRITGGEFVLGQFISEEGEMYAMVANRSMTEKKTAFLTFAQDVKVSEVKPHGGHGVQTSRNSWRKTLNPGDGVLIKIETGSLKYSRWDYSVKHTPRLSVYAPDEESLAAAENVKRELAGKVTVNIISRETKDPARLARRFGSDAYIIFGDKSRYLHNGGGEAKRLADLIAPGAAADDDAFKADIDNIFCPTVMVADDNLSAEGIARYFE